MKINKILFFLFFIFFFTGCLLKPSYYNYKNQYKFNYPTGWLVLNSGKDKEKQNQFINKIKTKNTFIHYETVDVVLCNPLGKAPVYDFISVATIPRYINFSKVSKDSLETLILVNLASLYDNVLIIGSQFIDINRFHVLQMDLSFEYQEEPYLVTAVILPGNISATHIFTTIYRPEDKGLALDNLNDLLQSFRKI